VISSVWVGSTKSPQDYLKAPATDGLEPIERSAAIGDHAIDTTMATPKP
jgi:hypothetical protein